MNPRKIWFKKPSLLIVITNVRIVLCNKSAFLISVPVEKCVRIGVFRIKNIRIFILSQHRKKVEA